MDDVQVAVEAARAAGAVIAKHFGGPVDATWKGKFDPVTAVDREAEAAVLAILAEHRPRDEVMAEESGGTRHGGRHWIVDPLDGTVNFLHGIPHVSVSVALYDGDSGLVGVVFDPLRDELFTASRGGGSQLNGHSISVSVTDRMQRAVVATGFPYDHDVKADELSVVVREVLRQVNGIRRFGSAALELAWVAAGRYDGYWEFGIAPWDVAAGFVLVREAGGRVTDPLGRDSTPSMPNVVTSNGILHDPLRSLIEASMTKTLLQP